MAALIWLFSTRFTGHNEPWDGSSGYYVGGLLMVGVVSALVTPRPLWGHYVGAVLGQVAYMAFAGGGALILVGLVFAALYSIAALFGAALVLMMKSSRKRGGNAA